MLVVMSSTRTTPRPTSLDHAREVMGRIFTPEALEAGVELKLRPSDVVISPFSKCGTTWLQQIVHTLRTRGDMDFDDISRVVPWIETSHMLGIDLQAEQKAAPRAFKSHLDWHAVPKGGRYIVAVRNPGDALVSAFRFLEGWFFETGSVSSSEFADSFFLANRGYWKHLASWWAQRDNNDVLLLAYEHMKADPTRTISRVAAFIDVGLDDELLAITEEQTRFTFMKKHSSRFDDLLMRRLSEDRGGLPSGSDSTKVRSGQVGGRAILNPAINEKLDRVWKEEITSTFGYLDYGTMIADI